MRLKPFTCLFSLLSSLPFVSTTAHAVILRDTASRNTSAPTGLLAGSGWQFEGKWGDYLATPIAPNYFLAAAHVGGRVGDIFTYNGQSYTTIGSTGEAGSDLAVWQVRETFSIYAPIYTGSSEAGKQTMIFGRGTARGEEVHVPQGDTSLSTLRGWGWGANDTVPSWGESQVSGIAVATQGDGSTRQYLALPFSQSGAGGSTLSAGDSSGGVFINDGGVWKLAGINYAVDGNYSYTQNGNYFGGAVFDKRGLYEGTSSDNFFWANSGPAISSDSYATRVSSRFAFIQSATQGQVVPEPGAWLLMAVGLGGLGLAQRVRIRQKRAVA